MKHIIKHLLIFLYLLINIASVFGQKVEVELQKKQANTLSNPFAPIYWHYKYTQPETYHLDTAIVALYPNDLYFFQNVAQRKDLAHKLRQIYNATGFILEQQVIPFENNYVDTTANMSKFAPFKELPEIYVVRNPSNGRWYYSKETLQAIPIIHNQLFPFESDKLLNLLPDYFSKTQFLGLTLTNYTLLLFLLIAIWLIYKTLKILLFFPTKFFLKRFKKENYKKEDTPKIDRPLSLLIISISLGDLIAIFHFPAFLTHFVLVSSDVATPIFAMLWLFRMIEIIGSHLKHRFEANKKHRQEQLVPFVQSVLKVAIIIISIIYILQGLGVNVTAILAGLSIGGLAFALAAQDTIKNLFGSITILLDSPFQIDDWIIAENIDGQVEEIGFRSTRIRSFDNSVIYVPNGKMADLTIDNLGLRIYRRYRTMISITYDTPVPLIKAFLKGSREIILKHPRTRKDFFAIYMHELGATSLDILFNVFILAKDFTQEFQVREELILNVIELAQELGVRFAFPTQTLHIEEMPDKESLTPVYEDLTEDTLSAKVAQYIEEKFGKK